MGPGRATSTRKWTNQRVSILASYCATKLQWSEQIYFFIYQSINLQSLQCFLIHRVATMHCKNKDYFRGFIIIAQQAP